VATGRISTGGSIRPVGRMTCSAKTPPVRSISQAPGVAETWMVCGRIASHSSKRKRAVVDGRRQAEAVLDQRRLAVEVAAEHAADLRHGDVAFVDEHEAVVGQVFEQGGRRLAGRAAGEVARVVLDAGARAGGHHHLDVEQGALLQPLGLEHAAGGVELFEALVELGLDRFTAWSRVGLGVT
jgi:hypothetical protein